MTEKRFRYVEATDGVDEHIIDYSTEPHFEYYTLKGATDKLNELSEENKLLLRKNGAMEEEIECLSEENEQLKQFKEDVFNKIDMHLRMLPTARDNEFNEDDGDPSLYTGAIYMLETLKKELS